MKLNDLESVTGTYLYWAAMLLFYLMSKDTRAGSRRTKWQVPQCVASLDIRKGAQQPHKERANSLQISDAPALFGVLLLSARIKVPDAS